MDLLKLDEQIESNLERLKKILDDSEEKLNEASDLKEYFENQTIGLRNAYKKRLDQLESEFKQEKEVYSGYIDEISECYTKVVALFEKLDAEKKEFDLHISNFNKIVDKRWNGFSKENNKKISDLKNKTENKIEVLEERFDKTVKYYDDQVNNINVEIKKIREEINIAKKNYEHINKKLDDGYINFGYRFKGIMRILKVGFGVSGLLFIVLLLGWFLK